MGTSQNKSKNQKEVSEECKKEYFKFAQMEFTKGIKKINSTIHVQNPSVNEPEESWVSYLLEKFNEYLNDKKINSKYIQQIICYLNNTEDSNEAKHVYNLSLYLSKEIEDMSQTLMRRQSFIDKYFSVEETKSQQGSVEISLNKDEMLWKGSEFVFKDIEDINHPIYGFIKNLTFILGEVYEKEYTRLLTTNPEDYKYHSDILIEVDSARRKYSMKEMVHKISYTQNIEGKKSCDTVFLHLNSTSAFSEYKHIEEFYQVMHSELMTFSTFLAGALVRFYAIKNSTSPKFFEIFCEKMKDMMIRRDLYKLIYKIKSKLNHKKKDKFAESVLEYYNIKPHYLCTSPYFSLDKNFRALIKEYMICKKIVNGSKEKTLVNIPFTKSILLFRQINENDSIIKKIDIMYQLRASILGEIDEFWEGIPLKAKYKSVDADNLLSIFIYLMIKSQMDNLVIDLEIIDDFTNRNLKLSRKGYFFSLFQSSIEYLIGTLSPNQLDFNIAEYNNMLNKEIAVLDSTPENILEIDQVYKSGN